MESWDYKPARDIYLHGLDRYRSLGRETGLVESTLRLFTCALLRLLFHAWNRLGVEGRHHLPATPPFVIVANHASHLDALIVLAILPVRWRNLIYPVAAKDVFFERQVVAGLTTVFVNTLPIWRGSGRTHDLTQLRDKLTQEQSILILFPEGTRTRSGSMNPFRPGIGRLVAGTAIPVVPCWIQGAAKSLPPGKSVPRPARILARFGPSRCFDQASDDRSGWQEVTRRLEASVTELSTPVERSD